MIKQKILVTVDAVIFTLYKDQLQVMLIQRAIEPYIDMRALPWWFVLENEDLDSAILRKLKDETSIDNTYLEQLYTFSDVKRDPRGRVISCAYLALMKHEDIHLVAWSDAKSVKLHNAHRLPSLAFDHKKILTYAMQRLKYKLEYTNWIQFLLPESFTVSELHQAYEIILQTKIDIRNFSKKVLKLGIIMPTGEKVIRWAHRPAMLYKFTTKNLQIVEIL